MKVMKIAQVLPSGVWGEIGPAMLDRGVGGREGSLIRLSKEWAKLGHEVTNFVPTKNPVRVKEGEGFHEYVPSQLARPCMSSFPYDACVAWEVPSVYNNERITGLQQVRLVEMQCANMPSDEDVVAANHLATGIVTLSDWARDYMMHDSITLPLDRMHVLPNCIDFELYPEDPDAAKKFDSSPRLFYSSSPDRGLWHLLRAWPTIRQLHPDAELVLMYGLKDWVNHVVWAHSRAGEMALQIAELINQDGITDLGKVGQIELANVQRSSTLWVYPTDTIQPTETGCITAIEAMAAYCPVITTDCDCMAEEFEDVAVISRLPYKDAALVNAMEETLGNREFYESLQRRGRAFAETRQWRDVAPEWIRLFEREAARS